MHRLLISCLVCLFAFSGPSVAKSLGLVIGNDRYQNVPALQKAGEDAQGYAEYFRMLGFDVTLAFDLTGREMTVALATFLDRIEPGDTVAFVFSGHGWSDGRENFLVPVDIAPSGSETLLSKDSIPLRNGFNGIVDEISKRGARFTLAIIDACRDNPFAAEGNTRSIGIARGLAPVVVPRGTFLAFSAGAGQMALDRLSDGESTRYSVFTRYFLQELAKPQSVQAAFKQTQQLVNTEAERVGHAQRPAYYDEVVGIACLHENCNGSAPAQSIGLPAAAPAQTAPPQDLHAEAATAWAAFQNSTSITALNLFAQRYAGTAYAELANERIAHLTAPAPRTNPDPVPQMPLIQTFQRPSWCPKAADPTEVAICSSPDLAGYDLRLNAAYQNWITRLDANGRRQLNASQNQWQSYRNSCGADFACIQAAYQSRLGQLENR